MKVEIEWIDVEKELPEVGGYYYVVLGSYSLSESDESIGKVNIQRSLFGHSLLFYSEEGFIYDRNDQATISNVTHWAYLPEVPLKKKNEEGKWIWNYEKDDS